VARPRSRCAENRDSPSPERRLAVPETETRRAGNDDSPREGGSARHSELVDIRELGAALVDLVLPTECAGCTAPPSVGAWCATCAGRLGAPAWIALSGGPVVLTTGRYTGPLRTALLRYKERGRRDLATPLARLLLPALEEVLPDPPGTTWLVPAPSRKAAARARGGDHVARLARTLATARPDIRVTRALALARHTRDSVGLDAAQRAANLVGRLHVRHGALPPSGTRVVLVDDIVTTGATLCACRAALADVDISADTAVALCDATSGRDDHEHSSA
jgi:predicted amidophosphoribosyltransferase